MRRVGADHVPAERPPGRLRVLLVCMPWLGLHLPSLALSTLAPLVRGLDFVDGLDVRYVNIEWAQYLRDRTGGRIGSGEYSAISENDFSAIGEWVFSGSLYDRPDPAQTAYHRQLTANGRDTAVADEMYRLAGPFVEAVADDICAGGYDVVGFTTTFVQNIPSFAMARAIKRRRPEAAVVFGGANCDDVQGAAMHRNFTFIDYVVRGEAERTFPLLLRRLAGATDVADRDIAGLCWRDERGGNEARANPMEAGGVGADAIPEAVHDDYFAALDRSPVGAEVRPKIILEGARGCWWGQKHHCTFCGLNNTLMAFRAKDATRILDELKRAVRKHRVLDVMFADNILDQRYLNELVPSLTALEWDLDIFFEVKSNLSYQQLAALARAGILRVQPGIESLSTHVLQLMRKGVRGWQNVRFLRDCVTVGIHPQWNVLYGFPGETPDDYAPVFDQMPHLVHLPPPQGASRVALTRFSPFFNDPGLGMVNEGPAPAYRLVYDLPLGELADLVYLFQSRDSGLVGEPVERLAKTVAEWSGASGRALAAFDLAGDGLILVDQRRSGHTAEHLLDAEEAAVYRHLLKGHSLAALTRIAREAGTSLSPDRLAELAARWREQGLVFQDGDVHVALATGLAY
ncbi:RiPP maturation radical SAM C-methyltransferase [Phytohabitans kaempferiae]|uniref:RiPP maturation radical SAM C-methyltransferase n=1 Tax=Phytohabitans kaempferiae TaxID=1620943 RepID=A0ABV6M544_9ACTN